MTNHIPTTLLPLVLLAALPGCVGDKDAATTCDTSALEVVIDDELISWMGVTDVNLSTDYRTTTLAWPDDLGFDRGEDGLSEAVTLTAYRCLAGGVAPDDCSITEAVTAGHRVQIRLASYEYAVVLLGWHEDLEEAPRTPYLGALLFGGTCEVSDEAPSDCQFHVADDAASERASPMVVGLYEGAGLIGGLDDLDASATLAKDELGWDATVPHAADAPAARVALGWLYEPELPDCDTGDTGKVWPL